MIAANTHATSLRAASAERRQPVRRAIAAITVLVAVVVGVAALFGSIAALWVDTTILDTDTFIAAAHPLATDTMLLDTATDRIATSVVDNLGADEIIELVAPLMPPSVAEQALAGLDTLVRTQVARAVASEQFAALWETNLRLWHVRFVAAATAGRGDEVDIDGADVRVSLGPYIDLVADSSDQVLIRALLGLVPDRIRSLQVTALSMEPFGEYLPPLRRLVAARPYLPWVAALGFALALIAARDKGRALGGVGLAIALAGGMASVTVGVVSDDAVSRLAGHLGASTVTVAGVVDTLVAPLEHSLGSAVLVGLAVAVAGVLWRRLSAARVA